MKSYKAGLIVCGSLGLWAWPESAMAQAKVEKTTTVIKSNITAADDFAMPKRFQKASDLLGKNVTNSEGENLGEIKDIVFDANSGRILYGVLSFGGVLGLGD